MHIILKYYPYTDDSVYYTVVCLVIVCCTHEKSAIYCHEFIFIWFFFFPDKKFNYNGFARAENVITADHVEVYSDLKLF